MVIEIYLQGKIVPKMGTDKIILKGNRASVNFSDELVFFECDTDIFMFRRDSLLSFAKYVDKN